MSLHYLCANERVGNKREKRVHIGNFSFIQRVCESYALKKQHASTYVLLIKTYFLRDELDDFRKAGNKRFIVNFYERKNAVCRRHKLGVRSLLNVAG